MATPTENGSRRLRGDLRASLIDGAAFGGMVGFGETYLAAFVLAIGLGELVAGMVSSLPLLAGGLMQLISPRAVRLLGSHRRWVVLCAVIQSATFIPLVYAAWIGSISTTSALVVAAVYWGTGLATGPAWNTWIGTLVPRSIRPRFFAYRTRVSQVAVFAGFLAGGLILQVAAPRGHALTAFAGLFAIAALCRVVSAFSLSRHSEPVPLPGDMRDVTWRKVFHHLRASSGGKLLVYLVAVQSAVQLAGPYFTPFMLRKLNFSYGELVTLFSLAFVAKVVSLPLWGRVAKAAGSHRLLWIGGIGIVPLGAAWLVSQHLLWLCLVQVFGGVVWAAYELAFFLLFFESISERERTSILTLYNLLNAAGWVGGALIGGAILASLGTDYRAYLTVFGLSTVARALAVVLLARIPKFFVQSDEIGVRTVAVRPGAATIDTPVLPSLPDQTSE